MIRSLTITAIILIVAAFLGLREKQLLSFEKEANKKIAIRIANGPSMESPPSIRISPAKSKSEQIENVKTVARDLLSYYDKRWQLLYVDYDYSQNNNLDNIEEELKSRLGELGLDEIKILMDEFKDKPDLSLQARNYLVLLAAEVFYLKYPIEMARMMSQSPELFSINVPGVYTDGFSDLVYCYSIKKSDLRTVFQCLSEATPEIQAQYMGKTIQFVTDSNEKRRAELLVEMRNFATTPEQKDVVYSKLNALVFGRISGIGSFTEMTKWISSASLSNEELVAATNGMQDKVRVGETGQWLDWLEKNDMPDDVSKLRAFDLATKWAEKDYKAVGEWLNSKPDSPEKAAVVSAYAAVAYPYDPETATLWLQTLPQGPDRAKALETIYQSMPVNSVEAEAFASEFSLGR